MRCRGFSLIELMVKVAVMATLSALGLPSFQGATCGGTWNDGWVVWNDLDASRSPGGDDDRILRYVERPSRLDITTGNLASTAVIVGKTRTEQVACL